MRVLRALTRSSHSESVASATRLASCGVKALTSSLTMPPGSLIDAFAIFFQYFISRSTGRFGLKRESASASARE